MGKTAKKTLTPNELLLLEQPKAWRESLSETQKKVFLAYKTTTKLRAVLRWPQRMAAARITAVAVAEKANIQRSRITEWCNFHFEPREENFLDIEAILYQMES